jgi:hypothetical protein
VSHLWQHVESLASIVRVKREDVCQPQLPHYLEIIRAVSNYGKNFDIRWMVSYWTEEAGMICRFPHTLKVARI